MKILATVEPYVDPVLEEEFKAFESLLLVHAKHHGQNDSLRNLPASVSDYQHLIGNYLYSETEQFIHAAAGKLQTFSSMATAKQLDENCFNHTAPLQTQLTDCDIAIAHLTAECKRLTPNQAEQVKHVFIHVCLGIMSAAEGLMAYQPFRYLGLPRYAAGIGALSVGIAIYMGCEYSARWIKKGKTARERLLRYSVILGSSAIGFFELAWLRLHGYQQAATGFSDAPQPNPSPCVVASVFIVSLLLFAVGLVAAVKTCRSTEQVRDRDAYRKARKGLKALQATRASLADEIASTEQHTLENSLESRQRHEYAAGLYQRIIASANKAQQVYITTNIRARGGAPMAFYDEIPPMRFNLFTNAKTEKP
jgi:hypothetical protein